MTTLKHKAGFTWENVSVLKYKEEGTHFKAITRQILFDGNKDLPGQLRYFEIAPGGHSTLERHDHIHAVMIIRGSGKALIGAEVISLDRLDVAHIPPRTWHQFQATASEPLGFLCLVNVERDKPERPNEEQLHEIMSNVIVAQFIKI
jgi:quercetin dioxygenase-like cupin family protein